jgi:Ca2+-binding RTX toxin-like protein
MFPVDGPGPAGRRIGVEVPAHSGAENQPSAPPGAQGETTMSDDYKGDSTSTGALTVGGAAVGGRIEVEGDADWFAVTLEAGVVYEFALSTEGSEGLDDPYLYLRQADGALLASDDDSGSGLNSLLSYVAAASGSFWLEVRAWQDRGTGDYRFTGESFGNVLDPVVRTGTEAADLLSGREGNDALAGVGGADTLFGGGGDDTLDGGDGDDLMRGAAGNDVLRGGDGNDVITADEGDDTVEGGAGNDVISLLQDSHQASGGAGDDFFSWGVVSRRACPCKGVRASTRWITRRSAFRSWS